MKKRVKFLCKKKGQVWIETVLYTMIALILIGAVLAFVIPKISEIRDQTIIEQSVGIMQNIDNMIFSVAQGGAGNKRMMDLTLKKGTLNINPEEGLISFEIESEYAYSEPGNEVNIGSITALTEEIGSTNKITLTSNYSNYNLTYNENSQEKAISAAATPYKMIIENRGGIKTNINIVVS
ncbi:hypothetical protein COU59_00915 [Candidatus Pacearchaeota archaeon CG10_big_fil_rev_8_21_14_0_10_34_12]|nr:MAG: hypothetical protein COU59_00915 [Candidatus Pacearchaeota archaeon CG10_big_fil_rev_8_21_14_0_10_34_12]